MEREEIQRLKKAQEAFFLSGKTKEVRFRLEALRTLHEAISRHEEELRVALQEDLGKSSFESDMCEIRLTLSEVTYMLRHTKRYAGKKRVKTNLANYVGTSYLLPSPYGKVLVMSPWNYPVLLSLEPLADALAAGNTVMLKPSAYSPATTRVIKNLLEEAFPPEYVAVIDGGRDENKALLEERFDYIFFTGSKTVGRTVMEKASRHLTPVTLELGGKSPVVVTRNANLKLTAKRLVFGKYLNCGQTCVAPDYVLVDQTIEGSFLSAVEEEIRRQYGKKPLENPNYGKIINRRHFERISGLLDEDKILVGGERREETLQIAPTVMAHVSLDEAVMKEEIFGPVLPVLTYRSLEEAVSLIRTMDHPLAFYVFSENKEEQDFLTSSIGFGGGCINDTILHLATSEMGFGGFGESGMGQYHGKAGFDTFTHYKSMVKKATWIDVPLRYQPYSKVMHRLLRKILH